MAAGVVLPRVAPRISLDARWLMIGGAALFVLIAIVVRGRLDEDERLLRDEAERENELKLALDQQKRTVDLLAEGLNVAIFVCDPKGTVLYANPQAGELFRFENPLGRTLLQVTISYDLEQLLITSLTENTKQTAEFTFTYPEERIAIAECWPDADGGRAFLSLYDVTQLRRLERIRRDFVANVSHELRTPLATIRAMAETLLDEPKSLNELQKRYLEKMVGEVDRLSLITQDLLVLSTAESNPVRAQECDLAETLRSVVSQLESKAKAKNLTVAYSGPDTLMVQANAIQLSQVAINLIDNAINYTQEGEILVEAHPDGAEVVFTVKDTGIGIQSEHLPRIFERFYRVDKGRSRATGGTGLGLSIVKHIVEAHGGSIAVESDFGKGTTFTVRLPALPAHEA